MRKGKTSKGMTLSELIVAVFLVVLLFYYIYKLLAPGLQVWRKSDLKVTLQQNALVGIYSLVNELRESNQNTITISNDSKLICFASPRNAAGDFVTRMMSTNQGVAYDSGEPVLQKFIIYYLDGKRNIRRAISPYTNRKPNGMTYNGDPWNSVDLARDRISAKNIETFVVSFNSSASEEASGWIDIKIVASKREESGMEDFATSLETTVEVMYDAKEY